MTGALDSGKLQKETAEAGGVGRRPGPLAWMEILGDMNILTIPEDAQIYLGRPEY